MHRIEETVARGICIGCGACVAASGGAIRLTLGPTRMYEPDITEANTEQLRAGSRVCPFSDESPNENQLGAPNFSKDSAPDPELGNFTTTFAGRVSDEDYLMGSSSGGLLSWSAQKLVDNDLVDMVISVGRRPHNEETQHPLFNYRATSLPSDVDSRKSFYYATTMTEAFEYIKQNDARYAITGIPCFIRAARALCKEDATLDSRLKYFLALVCGHFKTQAFGEALAWQVGVHPENLGDVDFRLKRPDKDAGTYDFGAFDLSTGEWRKAPTKHLVGGNWGHSAFQPEACNFCDDVVGETADVSFGDAWLPEFKSNPLGTNVVINRNPVLDQMFELGQQNDEIDVFELTPEEAKQSQAGGFRHRRQGLAVRLADDMAAGLSVPQKRVEPIIPDDISKRRIALIRQRRSMASKSHEYYARALSANKLSLFLKAQRSEARKYEVIEFGPIKTLYKRSRAFIGRTLRRLGIRK